MEAADGKFPPLADEGLLLLAHRLAGQVHAQLLEDLAVHFREHDRGMHLAAAQVGQLLQCEAAVVVAFGEHSQGHEHLVGVQARVVPAQVVHLQRLDGLYHLLGDELDIVPDAGEVLGRVEKQGGRCAQEVGSLGGNDGAVGKLDGRARHIDLGSALLGRHGHAAVVGGDLGLLHEQLDLVHFLFTGIAFHEAVQGSVVAADDLLQAGLAACLVVVDAEARHVDAHVRGRLIGVFAVDALEDGVQDREDLDVAVIVDRGLAVGLQVPRINHVHVVQVGGGGLVGEVHGVLQGQVPDGEGLVLGIAGLHTLLCFLVELAQADGHLAASRSGGRHHDERAGCLHIVVPAVALVAVDERHVGGIAGDGVVVIGPDAHFLELGSEGLDGFLAGVVRDDHAAHHQPPALELVPQAQDVLVVGDAQVAADLVLFDVHGADDDDDLRHVGQLHEHAQLAVGLESWEHAGGMVVIEELAAEFKVKLVAEVGDALLDALRLYPEVLFVVESVFHNGIVIYLDFRFFSMR